MAATAPILTEANGDYARVSVWKATPDDSQPWWEHWFFQHIFRPFLKYSKRYFRIPPPSKMNTDGSITFIEDIGIATDADIARAMCKDEFYKISWLPVNDGLPRESVEYRLHERPRSLVSGLPRVFPVAKPCAEILAEQKGVEALIARVDGIREKLRTPVAL
jgi:hypothetical protein